MLSYNFKFSTPNDVKKYIFQIGIVYIIFGLYEIHFPDIGAFHLDIKLKISRATLPIKIISHFL